MMGGLERAVAVVMSVMGHGAVEAPGHGLAEFWESWELYEHGVLAGVIVGATLGLLGVYVVLRRLVFLSAAIGQTASLGVVVSLYLAAHAGVASVADGALLGADIMHDVQDGGMVEAASPWWVPSPTVSAVLFTFLATLVIIGRKERTTVFREGLLGAIFLVGAAGTILLGAGLSHEMHAIEAILHGVGVAVLPEDFEMVWMLGLVVAVVHFVFWRGFAAVSFDPVGAAVSRMPVRFLDLMMAFTLALAIAAGIRALGALPVFALSILPSLAAIRIAPSLPWALVLGAVLGALAGFWGYALSFMYDWPVGASQTLVALGLVALTELVRIIWVWGRRMRSRH